MRVETQIIDVEDIVSYFVKGFRFKNGESLSKCEHYYDPTKGKMVMMLYIKDNPEDDSEEQEWLVY